MANALTRSLTVRADDRELSGSCRYYLSLTETMSLTPSLFQLDAYNLPKSDQILLGQVKRLSVLTGISLLAAGDIVDVITRRTEDALITSIFFSPSLAFWQSFVSVTIQAGVTLSRSLSIILSASTVPDVGLSFYNLDPVFSRPQAYHGRTADAVLDALSTVDHLCCITSAGLKVIPPSGGPSPASLDREDLYDVPAFMSRQRVLLTVKPAGWCVGDTLLFPYENDTLKGIVIQRTLALDTKAGSWKVDLILKKVQLRG